MADQPKQPERTKNNQVIAPAQPQAPVQAILPNQEAESYLKGAGWTLQSRNEKGEGSWADPAGQGKQTGTPQQTAQLPSKDGTDPVFVTQVVCPPAPWAYPLHEAMNIQRSRDNASKKAVA